MSKKIFIIFKTHLDIGFTDLAARVVERYLRDFIPQAAATADYFRNRGEFRFRWTVGSWLIRAYLDSAAPRERKRLETAIARGDIVWHALPFTFHSEYAGEALFRAGLEIGRELDRQFGTHRIAGKMTDVPGHTRGIIAPLVESGVKLLHIGINPISAAADVPRIFRWRDSRQNEICVVYQPQYGELLELPDGNIFLIAVSNDNTGPHTPAEVEALLAQLQRRYPDARLCGGTLDDLAATLWPLRQQFPLVTDELGDSWIHGCASDPRKSADFRELLRFGGTLSATEAAPLYRSLLPVAEHTCGMDEKLYLNGCHAWSGREIIAHVTEPQVAKFASSWQEQRDYLTQATEQLPDALRLEAHRRLRMLRPHRKIGGVPVPHGRWLNTGFWSVLPDADHGCLARICDASGEIVFRDFGRFEAQSFGRAEMRHFTDAYLREQPEWGLRDFGKLGVPDSCRAGRVSGFEAEVVRFDENDRFRLLLRGSPATGIDGTPRLVELEFAFSSGEPCIDVELRWFGKPPSRLPHALWFGFRPASQSCIFHKLGEPVRPSECVNRGGGLLHAIDGAIRFDRENVVLETLDAPLFAPFGGRLGEFPAQLPESGNGEMAFNLYNNFWGTNFPMWFDDDMRFRFRVTPRRRTPPESEIIGS